MNQKLAREHAMQLFTEQLWTLLDEGYTLRKLDAYHYKMRVVVECYRNGEDTSTLELSLSRGEVGHRDGGYGSAYWRHLPSWRVRCRGTLLADFYFYSDPGKEIDLEVDA